MPEYFTESAVGKGVFFNLKVGIVTWYFVIVYSADLVSLNWMLQFSPIFRRHLESWVVACTGSLFIARIAASSAYVSVITLLLVGRSAV